MAIPKFPLFKNIQLTDKDEYNLIYKNYPPHADFSFGNLLIWMNIKGDLELSVLNNNIIIRFTDPFGKEEKIYTVLGDNRCDDTISKIFELQSSVNNTKIGLEMVPEYFIDKIESETLVIRHDLDNSDYVFDIKEQVFLDSRDHSRARRKVRRYIREAGEDTKITPLNIKSSEDVMKLVNSLHQWDKVYNLTENDRTRQEGIALGRSFLYANELDLHCIGVFVKNVLHGFAIYQHAHDDYAIINHIKTSYMFNNIFDFITYVVANKLNTDGYRYMNFEQDLGIQGLRFHKQSMRPVKMFNKFGIYPK